MEFTRSYAPQEGGASSIVEVQDEHSQPSQAMALWEAVRRGEDDKHKKEFDHIVAAARRDLSVDTAAEFDYVLPIVEWRFFGGMRQALPQGLTYQYHNIRPKSWSIEFADDSVSWMHAAAERRLNAFGLHDLKFKVGLEMYSGTIDADCQEVLRVMAAATPLYQWFEGLMTMDGIRSEQPLNEYWKEVNVAMARHRAAEKYGYVAAHGAVRLASDARKHLARESVRVEEMTALGKTSVAASSDLAYGQLMAMIHEYATGTHAGGAALANITLRNDSQMVFEYEGGKSMITPSNYLLSLIDLPVSVEDSLRDATQSAAVRMLHTAVDWSHHKSVPSFEEGLRQWQESVSDKAQGYFKRGHLDEMIVASDGTLPDGPVRVMTVTYSDEQMGGSEVAPIGNEQLGYVSDEAAADKAVHGNVEYTELLPSSIPRMYLPGPPVEDRLTVVQADDVKIQSRHKGVRVPGYTALGMHEGFTVLRPGGHDPYGEMPVDKGWFATDTIARWYRSVGLSELADSVSQQQKMHVSDLALLLEDNSMYLIGVSDYDAARKTQLLRARKYGSLIGPHGRLEVHCEPAAQLLNDSLYVLGFESKVLRGHAIKKGAIGMVGHAQVELMLDGLPYMLDSTPAASNSAAPGPRNLAEGQLFSAVGSAKKPALTAHELIAKRAESLYKQLQPMYGVRDTDALFEAVNAIPATQRESDIAWRALSLVARISGGSRIAQSELEDELAYIEAVKDADQEVLDRISARVPTERQLLAFQSTLSSLVSIMKAH